MAHLYTTNKIWKDGDKIKVEIEHKNDKSEYIDIMVYSYDLATGLTALENGASIIATNLINGKRCIRGGGSEENATANLSEMGVGQFRTIVSQLPLIIMGYFGENICIPYSQTVHAKLNKIPSTAYYQAIDLHNVSNLTEQITKIINNPPSTWPVGEHIFIDDAQRSIYC